MCSARWGRPWARRSVVCVVAEGNMQPSGLYAEDGIRRLREVVAGLPFPPVAEQFAAQAVRPAEPAIQALLRAARDVLGDPSTAWDPRELQAIALAPYDEPTRAVVAERLGERWEAAQAVLGQLRGSRDPAGGNGADGGDAADQGRFGDDAAALHLIAVGLGLAMLAPISEQWSDARSWAALTARLLESLAAEEGSDPQGEHLRWRARVRMPGNPSAMARLLRVLSMLHVHVVSVFTAELPEGMQLVDMFLLGPDDVERSTIAHAIASVGTDAIVVRGREEDAQDVATRVLHLSARLAEDPEETPQAVAELVLADSWEVAAAVEGEDSTDLLLRLQWTPERHVVLRRARAPFTPTERNRASALLALVAAQSSGEESYAFGWRESLRDGRAVTIRLGRPDDMAGVVEMHDRCSQESRFHRYFTPMNQWREGHLRRISGGHRGSTLVVTDEAGVIVGLGNVFPVGPGDEDRAEIAVIVEDAWQGCGVGRLLTEHLVDVARRAGFTSLVAYVMAENRAMLGLLHSTGLAWSTTPDHDLGPAVTCLVAPLQI